MLLNVSKIDFKIKLFYAWYFSYKVMLDVKPSIFFLFSVKMV